MVDRLEDMLDGMRANVALNALLITYTKGAAITIDGDPKTLDAVTQALEDTLRRLKCPDERAKILGVVMQ